MVKKKKGLKAKLKNILLWAAGRTKENRSSGQQRTTLMVLLVLVWTKSRLFVPKAPPSLICPLGWADIPSWTDQDTGGHSFERTNSFFSRLGGTNGQELWTSSCSFHLPRPGHTHPDTGQASICPCFTSVQSRHLTRTNWSLKASRRSGTLTCNFL